MSAADTSMSAAQVVDEGHVRQLHLDGNIQRLLQHPAQLCEHPASEVQARRLAADCLLVVALGGALFGASVGWYRGPAQALAAAIKLPVVSLVSIAVCAPALVSLHTLAGQRRHGRHTLIIMLVATARASLLLAASAPLLWLGVELGVGYHGIKLWAAGLYGMAGLSAMTLLLRTFGRAPGSGWARVTMLVVFALVGGQSAWLLRPYIGSPDDQEVPLLVNREEGGAAGAVWGSLRELGEDAP